MSNRGDLSGINIESGVAARSGEPFLSISAEGEVDGEAVSLVGQLSPAEIRTMALHWLEAAEAAETDAGLLAHMTELGLPFDAVQHFVLALRARRDPR